MRQGAAFRGQPLLLLGTLLAGWLALRMALWEPPFEANGEIVRMVEAAGAPARIDVPPDKELAALPPAPASARAPGESSEPVWLETTVPAPLEPVVFPEPLGTFEAIPQPDPAQPAQVSPRGVIGHNLLLMAGLSQMEIPPTLLAYLQGAQPTSPGIPAAAPMVAAVVPGSAQAASRWSADGWLLLRQDTTRGFSGPSLSGRPSYGRSQAGAVIRYRLASESALRPQAYLRASRALAGAREQEIAAGLSARIIAGLPLRFAAEARVGETDRGTRVRPAAFAVTEFPPLPLPLGMRVEAYAQGGYVGGEFATAFVDGQARVERPIVRRGEAELSAGAGVWGGAQRDAARLDVGPTAAVSFRLGDARGRVAADYRFRVAGDAAPSSGPALTLSAGF